jgi:urease beta subunit
MAGNETTTTWVPGQVWQKQPRLPAVFDRPTCTVVVTNTGDRPVQVGSHFHFFEVNKALKFDRRAAYGMRLQITAGTAVRFEPGQYQTVSLLAFGGERVCHGFNGLVEGPLDDPQVKKRSFAHALQRGFIDDVWSDQR